MKAADRSFRSFYLGFSDWATVPLLWLLALLAISGVALMVVGAVRERSARDAVFNAEHAARLASEAKQRQLNDQAQLFEPVRRAVASGNLDLARKVLAGAIKASDAITDNPDATTVATNAAPLDTVQTHQIIDEAPVYNISPTSTPQDQLVFIQFAGVLTRAQITALNLALKTAGWRTQSTSGERTPAAAGINQIRYSGNNRAAAQALADAINSTGIVAKRVTPQPVPTIANGALEVWISR